MVSVDSPAVPAAALALAGTQGRGRRFTGGESAKGLVAAGFAGASADFVVNEALSATGMGDTVSSTLGQAILGAGLSKFGGPIPANAAMARGIHYNVMQSAFNDLQADLGSLMNGSVLGGNEGSSTASPSPTRSTTTTSNSVSQASPQTRNGGSNTVRFG